MSRPRLVLVGVIALIVVVAIVVRTTSPASLITAVIAVLVVGAFSLGLIGSLRETQHRLKAFDAAQQVIRDDGLIGRGTILGIKPGPWHTVGGRGPRRREVEIELEVHLPRHQRFTTVAREWLNAATLATLRVGDPVPIAADPAEPGHVVLALDHSLVDPAAIAALGPIAGGPGGPVSRPTPPERDSDR
jgi:hypothetical protein